MSEERIIKSLLDPLIWGSRDDPHTSSLKGFFLSLFFFFFPELGCFVLFRERERECVCVVLCCVVL